MLSKCGRFTIRAVKRSCSSLTHHNNNNLNYDFIELPLVTFRSIFFLNNGLARLRNYFILRDSGTSG